MARLDWIFVAINTFGVCMLINSIIGIYRHISAPHLGISKAHSNIKLCTCRLVLGEKVNVCTCRLVDVVRRNCSCVYSYMQTYVQEQLQLCSYVQV